MSKKRKRNDINVMMKKVLKLEKMSKNNDNFKVMGVGGALKIYSGSD